ncbi:placenta-specific protein 9 isoform X1 [Sorex araneus]|uniref:placenta-specific protein 9 isoform X1 n=1 Tax=Sorex araneus TaxID=42254 RepID=UPI002433922D|nr:placenta-specific protein 9 isoform X1 [Sorex araneus]
MRAPLGAALALLALLCGAAADPAPLSRGDSAGSTGCARDQAVQDRLDVLEEEVLQAVPARRLSPPVLSALPRQTVEKTVEQLEAEVKDLLGLLEALWPLAPALGPAPDLLGGGEQFRPLFSAGGEEGPGSGE